MSSWFSNLYVQVGLLSLGTFYLLESMKPDFLYDRKSGQPKNEMLTPVSVAVAVGFAWLYYQKYSGGGGSAFRAQCVQGMDLAGLDGYSPGMDQGPMLPPATFDS